jgi:APA family basic amino acid/polyamine antiporter
MLGAGVFSVFSLSYAKAQSAFFIALILAALVAALNSASVYSLAKQVSRAGGIYAYSRHFANNTLSFVAGFVFVFGKIGSIAAIAWIFGDYLAAGTHQIAAIGAIVLLTALNILGINRTAAAASVIAVTVVAYLAISAVSANLSPMASQPVAIDFSNLDGVLPAASLIFFAFAGYARVATLGDEVREPRKNIPLAIVISLSGVLVIYLLLSLGLVRVIGSELSQMTQSLLALNAAVNPWLPGWAGQLVAALASLGSMLALLAGVSRTSATMAEDGELPRIFALRNRFGSPWVSEVMIAAGAIVVFFFNGYLTWIIGFSSFSVLLYYAIGHISVLRQPAGERGSRLAAVLGFALCLVLMLAVPGPAVWVSAIIIAAALAVRAVASKLRNR